ncbi:dimethylallyl tryptophan synthase GliD1 [Alternaria rosae]|uniref:dimethylallyl tryptophan synthase GliD1 n=1 Tax=Alternaria rosae TaxID=1187941 RepID=UPI001E8CC122|nr:dimethylallyl tryptophan synthase GliD1 [Alternaria rosae]KAH6857478.1 dimethylallyl tryptophan synthase GliD1 [Alternaria rosae]
MKSSTISPTTKIWESLRPLLPSRGSDCDYWWNYTGLHLAYLLEAAGYSTERQYEALLFHYHLVVPYLGPAPASDGTFHWPTVNTIQGPPVEYSWKWNTGTGAPELRYTFEAVDKLSGSPKDPLNQGPSRDMLYHIASAYPSVDLAWTNHFLATLFDHDQHRYAQEQDDDQITTTVMIAAEFVEPGPNIKLYLKSRRLGMRDIPLEVYKEAIFQASPTSAAATALYDFLEDDPEGQLLKPAILGLDCVAAPNSRIKLYFRTPHVRFSTIHTIMTLNNRKAVSASQTESLRKLLAAVTGLPLDFPDEADWPINSRFGDLVHKRSAKVPLVYPACGFYFDIAPGREIPNVKVQVPLYVYGQEEQQLAEGVSQWMKDNERGKFADQFLKALPRLGDRGTAHGPDRVKGQVVNGSYLSVMFTPDDQLEVTTYLTPVLSETPWVA